MYIVDEDFNVITEYDERKGHLEPCIIIDPKATPIDDIHKFAWSDEDYIEAKMYVTNNPEPDSQPTVEERLSDCELVLAEIMGGAI